KMNPFKSGSGGRSKRKPKSAKVEVKQEPGIKEEPNDGDDVMNIPRPRVDRRYRANYEGLVDFGYDFNEVKDEIKCEEEETGEEKDSTPRERSNDGAANDDDNEDPMGDAIDVQPPQAVGSQKKRNESSKRRNKRTIPRNQAAKKQKKHKCHISLNQHLSTAHSDHFPFQCSKCFGGYVTEDTKIAHQDNCGYRQYQCHRCKELFRSKQMLKIHMRKDHTGERIQCKVCAVSFTNESNANTHMKNEMNPFKGGSGRRSKRKPKSAKVEIKQEPVIKEEPNDIDDVMNIPRPRVDGRYRANYEGPFDFGYDFNEVKNDIKCEEEETGEEKDSTPRERSNDRAANDDGNEEPMDDAIDVQPPQPAGSGKKQNENLMKHMRIHSGAKPFECSICFKLFATKDHLQRHSMTHKNELPNACSKCDRRFASSDDKQTHETRCQRSIFACNQCHYQTVHKHCLKLHMQSKHGAKKSIECGICRKEFIEQIKLNRHLSTAHSDLFPFQCSKCFGGYATEDEKEITPESGFNAQCVQQALPQKVVPINT
ncbi:zinc finger protein 41-like, partial [Sitodiplosis mosellana]|uniref:zinc finger protein 41-like n=1 Tax=Sitodiplosis mosellana TaxID=263140 RepID=UPI0024452A67